jgi:hypothetical protein
MAILIKKDNSNIFVSGTGIVTNSEKKVAEQLSVDLQKSFAGLELKFLQEGILSKSGTKRNALAIWYKIGNALNILIDKYQIRGSADEPFFWQSIYDYVPINIQKNPPPKRSHEWRRNHFRLCAKMAERSWEDVEKVGSWSVWRDLFDNNKILEDDRVLKFVIERIKSTHKGHKELRPFIHKIRRELKKVDTSVLSNEELNNRLKDL